MLEVNPKVAESEAGVQQTSRGHNCESRNLPYGRVDVDLVLPLELGPHAAELYEVEYQVSTLRRPITRCCVPVLR